MNFFPLDFSNRFFFICGPCVLEEESFCLEIAQQLKELFIDLNTPFIFKASYDKANRTSLHSSRGPGLKRGLAILSRIGQELKIPILTDVHTREEAEQVAEVADVLQIPAFLCRQTDLILAVAEAAAKWNRVVNVKKGQFLSPLDIPPILDKITSRGQKKILLTERGVCFGYRQLVSDFRSIPMMKKWGYPVCFDATHSVQEPGALKGQSGGKREWIPFLARAAVAVGADLIYLEVHPDPEKALCDAASMLPLKKLPDLVKLLLRIRSALQEP